LVTLLAGGLTNRQIGRELGIAEGTVRKHLEHVYARLGVTNRVAVLAVYRDLQPNPAAPPQLVELAPAI
jgi:DNA-binding NarL/FixJ family response regulator